MISDNQTDIFFNNRLQNYPSAVPADMWTRIVEKKKKDRAIWLFFLRLFALVILSLALTGGYYIFEHRKSSSVGMDSTIINQSSANTDTVKTSSSNLPSGKDQMQVPQLNEVNKKTNQKRETQISYSDKFDHMKENAQDNQVSSKLENSSVTQSTPADSLKPSGSFIATNSNDLRENKTEHKNDSVSKKAAANATIPDSSQSRNLKKPEEKNNSSDRKWYLDLYASPDYPIVSPHENEPSKLSYTVGLKLNRSLGNHFSVKTGIQYSRLNIVQTDSGLSTIHLNRLDMPVLAGYSMGKGNLKTTIDGGVIFNLYTWPNGLFKANTGVSLYLGVDFEEKINNKISLFAEPYYRYQLTNMTADTISYLKFVDVVGINIGVRYCLKNKHSGK